MSKRKYRTETMEEAAKYKMSGHTVDQVFEKYGVKKTTLYNFMREREKEKTGEPVEITSAVITQTGNVILPIGSGGAITVAFYSREKKFLGQVEMALYPSYWDMYEAAHMLGTRFHDFTPRKVEGQKEQGVAHNKGNTTVQGYYVLRRNDGKETSREELLRG